MFIKSRLELVNRLKYREMSEIAYHDLVPHNVPSSIIGKDILVFLEEKSVISFVCNAVFLSFDRLKETEDLRQVIA